MTLRILFAGGGTGGHVYPALTIAKAIRSRHPDAEIRFIGSRRGPDKDLVTREGFEITTIDMMGLERRVSSKSLAALGKASLGVISAACLLMRFRPDMVIGTGGYICGPVLPVARILSIPVAIQEQNVVPGFTNRVLSRIAKVVFASFEESKNYFPDPRKVLVVGNPVRPEIIQRKREEGASFLGLKPDRPTILVYGGSLGAVAINNAVCDAYPDILKIPRIQVIHQTGPRDFERVKGVLQEKGINAGPGGDIVLTPYLYDMPSAFAAADLVVMRAGGSVAEVTARGLPAILIPLAGAPGAHQERNAQVLQKAGAAIVIPQENLSGEVLASTIVSLFMDPSRLSRMASASKAIGRPDSVWQIVDVIEEVVSRTSRARSSGTHQKKGS